MKIFECDFDLERKNKDISHLKASKQDSRISIAIQSDTEIGVVWLDVSKTRELAAELIKLADEIDGVYRHNEIRGTMLCSSLVMPIKPRT